MVQTNATALVNSAKSDFPSQTSAITSSVDALQNSVASLSSNPLRREYRHGDQRRDERGELGQ